MPVIAAYTVLVLLWSTTPLAIQWSTQGAGFLFPVMARMLIGAALCGLLLAVLRSGLAWHARARATYAWAGFSTFSSMLLVYWGALSIPSGQIALLFGLSPIFTGLAAAALLREASFTPAKVTGMGLGVVGLAFVFGRDLAHGQGAWLGSLAVLTAALLQSVSMVMVKRLGGGVPALTVTTGTLLVVAPLFVGLWAAVDGRLPPELSPRAELSIVYLGVFGSVLGFFLYYYIIPRLQAGQIALISLMTPVTALLLGHFLNREPLGGQVLVGAALILAGLACHQFSAGRIRRFWRTRPA